MKNSKFAKTIIEVLKLSAIGLLIGLLGGLLGASFSYLLSFVTGTREAAPFIILLLPLGGIVTVALYRYFGMSDYGTNSIILGLRDKKPIRTIAAPLIFVCTAITHLLGGSAGKEGAAIQLGGAGASALCGAFRVKEDNRAVWIMSGMSAVFAAVFGTPLTAAFFVLEFKMAKRELLKSFLPCVISAIIAAKVSSLLGVEKEIFYISDKTDFTFGLLFKIIVLAVALNLLGILMCFVFKKVGAIAKKWIKNPFVRTIVGSVLIILLTHIVGDMRYNGSGMELAIEATTGTADWFDFILKLIFTAITIAAGFKGGEIVPTFCIGATFGCAFGACLGLDLGFAAALGLVGLFCSATNSLVGAVLLSLELFGLSSLPYFMVVCLMISSLSLEKGLFENRFFKSPIYLLKYSKP